MPDPSIVEELKKRGLLATGGNIRSLPFGESEVGSGNGTNTVSPAASASTVTPNPDGTINATDLQGKPVVIDPKNITPEQADTLDDNSINGLLPFLTGAVGGVIAQRLLSRRGKTSIPPTGADIPVVEGEVVNDPLAALPGGVIEEGEFTEVPKALTGRNGATAINGPPNNLALPAPSNRIEGDTAQALAARKLGTVQPMEQSRVALPDAMSDLSSEDLAKARAIAEQLVMRRQKGNVKAYTKGKGTAGLPTSPNRKTENVDDMLGVVIRMIREGKIKPQQLRMMVP